MITIVIQRTEWGQEPARWGAHPYCTSKSMANISPIILRKILDTLEAEKLCLKTSCKYRISLDLQKPGKNWQSKTHEKHWLKVSHVLTSSRYCTKAL